MSEDSPHYPIAAAAAALVIAAVYILITIDQRDPACAICAGWLAGVLSTIALACHWADIEPVHPLLECIRIGLQPTPYPDHLR